MGKDLRYDKDLPKDEQGHRQWHYKRRGKSNRGMGDAPVTQVVMMGIEVQPFSIFRTVDTKKGKV